MDEFTYYSGELVVAFVGWGDLLWKGDEWKKITSKVERPLWNNTGLSLSLEFSRYCFFVEESLTTSPKNF